MNSKIIFTCSMVVLFLNIGCGALPEELKKLEDLTIFKISNDEKSIVLDGVINSSAYNVFKRLTDENPQIKRLEIVNCDGSINDDVNLKLAKYIYDKGFSTHLNDNGLVASGGTDLFLAGRKRTKGVNTKIGVHSWAGSNVTATDFPVGHKNHLPYIKYYVSVGFTQQRAEDFYYFTINAAPAEGVHWMTALEIEQYIIVTE